MVIECKLRRFSVNLSMYVFRPGEMVMAGLGWVGPKTQERETVEAAGRQAAQHHEGLAHLH